VKEQGHREYIYRMAQTERRVGGNTGGIGGIKRKKRRGKENNRKN